VKQKANVLVETLKYEVLCQVGNVEIRRYPKIVVAKVTDPQADAFSLLYNFITGNNARKQKVKMTSPVVSEKIAMTAPVLSDNNSMAFVMPNEINHRHGTRTLRQSRTN
jgi:hypothetical protein